MMKLAGCLVILFLSVSCGKNAFLKDDSEGSIIRGVEGDNDGGNNCVRKAVEITETQRPYEWSDHPFEFTDIRQGDHTSVVHNPSGSNIEIVDWAQVVIHFDLSELTKIDANIEHISLTFNSDQYFRDDYGHKSQICHNQNYQCSGNKQDVEVHIINNSYKWIDGSFIDFINSFPATPDHEIYCLREIRGTYSMNALFGINSKSPLKSMTMEDLKENYTVFIADNHKVTNARLNIEYCE